jgi:hypothetical protein
VARTGGELRRPARCECNWPRIAAGAQGRPRVGSRRTQKQRVDRQGPAQLEPGVELLPRPAVHPDLRPATALSGMDQDGAALRSSSASASARASLIRSPARHSAMITAQPHGLAPSPRASDHRDDLLHGRRVRRIAKGLVARHAPPDCRSCPARRKSRTTPRSPTRSRGTHPPDPKAIAPISAGMLEIGRKRGRDVPGGSGAT